jgi:hypothetical protein
LRYWSIILGLTAFCADSVTFAWSPEPPHPRYLDKIETALAADRCVGDLRRWERRYAYHEWMTDGGSVYHLDSAVIDFELREVGKFGFRPGRKFVSGPLVKGPDDRAFKVVFGNYDFRHNRLAVTFCGPNAR